MLLLDSNLLLLTSICGWWLCSRFPQIWWLNSPINSNFWILSTQIWIWILLNRIFIEPDFYNINLYRWLLYTVCHRFASFASLCRFMTFSSRFLILYSRTVLAGIPNFQQYLPFELQLFQFNSVPFLQHSNTLLLTLLSCNYCNVGGTRSKQHTSMCCCRWARVFYK